jgi:hypothetical protein
MDSILASRKEGFVSYTLGSMGIGVYTWPDWILFWVINNIFFSRSTIHSNNTEINFGNEYFLVFGGNYASMTWQADAGLTLQISVHTVSRE